MLGEEAQPAALHPSSHGYFLVLFLFVFVGGMVSVEGTDIRTENEQEGMGGIFRRWQGAAGQVMVLPGGLEGPVQQMGRGKVEGGMGDVRCY